MSAKSFFSAEMMGSLVGWSSMLHMIFPQKEIPLKHEWHSLLEILGVLNIIGAHSPNHLFFPTGGGMDFENAGFAEYEEPGCIELRFSGGGSTSIVKPARLEFHKIDDSMAFSYFRLNLAPLVPFTGAQALPWLREGLVDMNGTYIPRKHWDSGIYDGKPIPDDSRLIYREWGKCMLIFGKGSPYNCVTTASFDSYMPETTTMDTEKFNEMLKRFSQTGV